MSINDPRFDTSYKFISYPDKGPWSTRFTSWYVAGLLQRNEGLDLENAKGALESILSAQYTDDFDAVWYGTWKLSPDRKCYKIGVERVLMGDRADSYAEFGVISAFYLCE
jgi:hypothetical protein